MTAYAAASFELQRPSRPCGDGGPAAALPAAALAEYQGDVRALVSAFARSALAVARDGRLDGDGDDDLAAARAAEREAGERFSRWNRAGAPHIELARELGCSPLAAIVVLIAAAPLIWPEVAAAYVRLAGDPGRPLVDEQLVAQLLEADIGTRRAVARVLDDHAPLRCSGAVSVAPGRRPHAAITVDADVIGRLTGGASRLGAGCA